MMRSNIDGYLAVLAGAVCLAIAGGWTLYNEGAPYFRGGTTSATRLAQLLGTGDTVGLTTLTQRATLLDCQTALRTYASLEIRYQGDAFKAKLAPECLSIADAVTADFPTDSFAWLVGATASARMEDWQGFNKRLNKSQATGPNEEWVAQLRVDVGEDYFNTLTPASVLTHDADLFVLTTSLTGRPKLAERYVRDAGFRPRMARILAIAPLENQKNFLSLTNRLLKAQGR